MTASARDLILLQGEVDANAAVIAGLQHETAVSLATVAGAEKALKKHLGSLHEEIHTLRQLADAMRQRVQGGPTVKTSEVDAATARRDKKRKELRTVQRDISVLEGLLKEFIHAEPLRLRELFDIGDPNDEVALSMLLDQRPSALNRLE